ncbi:MAG TPA: alternative ribosome rescue aminoacyl-tRNA hydrolase ArfB [Candidatus Paceibacterota bacterium]
MSNNLNIVIPPEELAFSFSRSSGAGGQNVNKLETKVTVSWDFNHSSLLDDAQKLLLAKKFTRRISTDGKLMVSCQTERSQSQNRGKAIANLNQLVMRALIAHPKRKATKVPFRERVKRLATKRYIAQKKQLRKTRIEME